MHTYETYGYSMPATRRFSFAGALRGYHRPSRVAAYGVTCLLAYAIAALALVRTGALLAIVMNLAHLGAARTAATAVPLVLLAGYALIWVWLVVALWNSAPNAYTRFGYHLARGVSAWLAFLLCAACVMFVGVS